jgi:hypothetical protein
MTTNADPKTTDKIVYFGVININENTKTVGAVDVWRSVTTKDIFCEEKRLGVLDISDQIGMPTIDKNKKWAVAVSRKKDGKNRWKLIKLIKEGKFKFADADDETYEVDVKDYKIIDNDWCSFLVETNVNRNIDVNKETNTK